MQYEENEVKNPVHLLLFMILLLRIDLLWRESFNSPSLSNKLSKFTSVPQTSTVHGRLAGDSWLCSKLAYDTLFCDGQQCSVRMSCNSSNYLFNHGVTKIV